MLDKTQFFGIGNKAEKRYCRFIKPAVFSILLFLFFFSIPMNVGLVKGAEGGNLAVSINYPADAQIFYSGDVSVRFSLNATGEFNCTTSVYIGDYLNSSAGILFNSTGQESRADFALERGSYLANASCSSQYYSGASRTVQFFIFETPIISSSFPIDGAWQKEGEVNFSFSVESAELVKNCSVIDEGESIGTIYSPANGINNFSSSLSSGSHQWRVICELLAAGENSSISTEQRTIFVDSEPPSITIISPESNYSSEERGINLSLSASDNLAGNISCRISGLESPLSFSLQNNSLYHSQISLSKGIYSWNISCSDTLNNTALISGMSAEIFDFTLSTDKQSYSPDENVMIYLSAPNSTRVNLTISNGNSRVNYLTEPLYPTTYIFTSTSQQGNYAINASLIRGGRAISKHYPFSVFAANNLSLSVSANSTRIEKGDSVRFTSNLSGSRGAVSYRWDFNNDGITDSASANATYAYQNSGTYTARLNASDPYNSITSEKQIRALGRFKLAVLVKDYSSNPLSANVTFGNSSALSNSSGDALFANALEGNYTISIRKGGYEDYENNIVLESNSTLTFYLESLQISPAIIFISPEDNSAVGANSYVRFRVLHYSLVNCTLYSSDDGSWWTAAGNKTGILNNTEQEISLKSIGSGNHRLRIMCADNSGNSNSSAIISVGVSQDNSTDFSEIEDLLEKVGNLRAYFAALPPNDIAAAGILGIPGQIDEAEARVEQARRDLSDMSYSRKSAEEIALRRGEIIKEVNAFLDKIPEEMSVSGTLESVKYPSAERLSSIAAPFIEKKGLKIGENAFVSANSPVQALMTIYTKSMIVNLLYPKEKKTALLVSHRIMLKDNLIENESVRSNLVLVINVPKNVTSSADSITFLSESTVLKSDPVIEFPLSENISYYIEGIEETAVSEDIEIFLVQKSASVNIPLITGAAVSERTVIWPFNLIKNQSNVPSFAIQIIIVVALLSVYLIYTLIPERVRVKVPRESGRSGFEAGGRNSSAQAYPQSGAESAGRFSDFSSEDPFLRSAPSGNNALPYQSNYQSPYAGEYPKQSSPSSIQKFIPSFAFYPRAQIPIERKAEAGKRTSSEIYEKSSYASALIEKANALISMSSYDEASADYYELRAIFASMPEEARAVFYNQIMNLCSRLNLAYIRKMVSDANELISKGKFGDAIECYERIGKTYKMLPKEHKSMVFIECHDILGKLQKGALKKAKKRKH